eukprot:gnl/MRDRNA2_/MRDRNA2_104721_c0_seq1.p1 gnl/MRDRNA2_/MRDRNA2_104721_c0~~gnl/MRDRNA2_/MRDRNA2_104721_c0_seq1.p1  ORF type:complete len:567 (-),score=100.23 gnl/MRDRNA2_/MRDRNA2_104721_c0_seq1:115-1815(-)
MVASDLALAEGLLQDDVPRSMCRHWKAFMPLALGLPVFWYGVQQISLEKPAVSMTWTSQIPHHAKVQQFVQPQLLTPMTGRQSMHPRIDQRFTQQTSTAATAGQRVVAAASSPELRAVAVEDKVLPMQSPSPVPMETATPGLAEDSYFQCDESVTTWKNFQRNGPQSPIENLREASSIGVSIAAQGVDAQTYVLAHGVRTGYFAANIALSGLALDLTKRLRGESDAPLYGGDGTGEVGLDLVSRFMLEAAMSFQQDYRAINDGLFKLPWDMYTPGHRQLTPQYAARQTARSIEEAISITSKRAKGGLPDDIGIWLESPLYPQYYKNNFHFQTDGWMASKSAQVYETSTENLFLGRQDAMQRLSLQPLHNALVGSSIRAPRILEVACGTGRFGTFIRDNHPTAELTLVDLSPFYLEAARENDEYWRKTRFPNENARPPAAKFVQAAAEALPFEDASFDAVVCVYLFHEMPEEARAAAAAEMARVVAPGGTVILTDSVQRGDRPDMDKNLGNFGKLNEPHYENYISTFLPDLFTSKGLTCDGKWVESVSKCISFRKPVSNSVNSEGSA